MKFLNIENIDSDFNEFAKAKFIIEQQKSKKDSLTDFIKSLNVGKYVLMTKNDMPLAFNFIDAVQDIYVFYCGKLDDEAADIIFKILSKSRNIFDSVREVSSSELAISEKTLPDLPFIIFNGRFWEITI